MQQQEPPVQWRSFWLLVVIQSFNALNEKWVQFLLVALGIWLGQALQYPLSVLIVLPFVLFAPLAGWLADRFSKARLLQVMVLLQVAVLAGMTVGLFMQSVGVAVVFFTVFCVQAMFFSPAKKGLVKEMVGTAHLGFAGGILEITSMLALLVGQIGALGIVYFLLSRWGKDAGWEAVGWPCVGCLIGSVLMLLCSGLLPRYAPQSMRPFRVALLWEHFAQLKRLWERRILRYSEIGIGFFWFIAGVMMLIALQMAQEAQGAAAHGASDFMQILGQQRDSAMLLAWISGGSVLGGTLASCICSRRIYTQLVLIGGAGVVAACSGMLLLPYGHTLFYVSLAASGFFAAGYLVPLNALLLAHAEDARRGDVIAAGNFVDCALGIGAVLVQWGMRAAGMSTRLQCGTLAVASLGMTLFLLRELRTCPPEAEGQR